MNEENLPPILTPPPIEGGLPAETEPRNFVGWALLATILALLCLSSLITSLSGKKPANQAKPFPYEILVEQEAFSRSMADKLEEMGAGAERADDLRKQASDSLTEPISDLVDKTKTDAESARWYAAMRTEQGKSVPPENIAILKRSKDRKDQAIAQVYSSEKLSKSEANDLVKKIGKKSLLDRLITTQALEKAGDKEIRGETFSWKQGFGRTLAVMIGLTILIGGGIVWMVFLRAKAAGAYAPLGTPLGPLTLANADRLAVRAAQILFAFIAISVVCELFLPNVNGTILEGIGILVALPLLASTAIKGKKISLKSVGLTTERFGENVLWGIGGFLAEFPISMLLAVFGMLIFSFLPAPSHPIDQQLTDAKNIWTLFPVLLFGSIAAPIWEEVVFRGLIFPALARVTTRIPLSAIMTGFIFAMIHPQGIALWFTLATVGSVGCALTYQRRSLIPTIVMHMLHNTTTFALALLFMGKF